MARHEFRSYGQIELVGASGTQNGGASGVTVLIVDSDHNALMAKGGTPPSAAAGYALADYPHVFFVPGAWGSDGTCSFTDETGC